MHAPEQFSFVTDPLNGVTQTAAYDHADQLTNLDGTTYSYDANGNLIAAGSDGLTWDANNQLSSASVNETTADYTYDGNGDRVSASSGGTTTNYLWDAASGLSSLVDDGTNAYLSANGVHAAIDGSGTTSYALTDALGSVRGLTDSSGTLTGIADYDVFGAVRAQTGASLPLGFAGQLTDPTTGFVDLRARDLDPALGRFLPTDLVIPNAPGTQGFNLYAYAANNPTTWADLSGHSVGSAINGLASLVAGCLAYLPCSGLLQEQLALAATAAVSGNWILGLGAAVGTVFVLVWCALTEPCMQASQDIQLIAKTYGGGVDTGGGNRPPSPASCIEDAARGWAAGTGNAADGVHACAEAIRTATGATVAPIRGGSEDEGESHDLGSTVLISQILQLPDVLEGKNPDGLLAMLGGVPPGWRIETLGQGTHQGQGFVLRQYTDGGTPTGRMIRWHPGGGQHGPGAYWRVTSGEFGTSERIPAGQWTP